ncbi:MAG: NUDIX hydrolase [Lachnospiraceae bacterium]|nr:NUDIX hydrolase [Lachnospiraceae bacterium]
MKLLGIKKVRDGKYLKNYELTYENKIGSEKKYEIVSHHEINSLNDIGSRVSGVSIVAICEGKLLLLREFRLGVNREIYNLCAGMVEDNESIEDCIARELFEETGLKVKRIIKILKPSFAAVALSDVMNRIAFVEVAGTFSDHTSANEEITASFYSKDEVKELLEREAFSSRAQAVAYLFTQFDFNNIG